MSAHRRIPDLPPKGAEGRSLTRLGHSADSGLTPRRPLPSLSDGLYTTRMPTLPWRSRVRADCDIRRIQEDPPTPVADLKVPLICKKRVTLVDDLEDVGIYLGFVPTDGDVTIKIHQPNVRS